MALAVLAPASSYRDALLETLGLRLRIKGVGACHEIASFWRACTKIRAKGGPMDAVASPDLPKLKAWPLSPMLLGLLPGPWQKVRKSSVGVLAMLLPSMNVSAKEYINVCVTVGHYLPWPGP